MASHSGSRVLLSSLLNPTLEEVIEYGTQYRAMRRHGRYYHAWKPEKYPFPCDVAARDGEKILNGILHLSNYGKGGLHDHGSLANVVLGPLINDHGPMRKILDLGCGSGTWVLDTADRFPNAVVYGVDLVENQEKDAPSVVWRVPNSAQGALDFEEDLSGVGLGTFDYLRMAHLHVAVSDECALLAQAFNLTVPGTGIVEYTFVDWTFRTANTEPLPPSSPLVRLQHLLSQAFRNRSVPLYPDPSEVGPRLVGAGFTDRLHRVYTLPLTHWSLDRSQFRAGKLMQTVLICHHRHSTCKCFLEDLCLELLVRWLGVQAEDVRELIVECTEYLNRIDHRVFVEAHCFLARRP